MTATAPLVFAAKSDAVSIGGPATDMSTSPAVGSAAHASAAHKVPVQPRGPGGSWSFIWHDGFNGTSLDTTKWSKFWFVEGGSQNNVATHASNVTEGGGHVTLTLASSTSGASITTNPHGGATTGVQILPGEFAEARLWFSGDSSGNLYNWPAWWTDGQSWPTNGENDIAEVLGGDMTVNYHSGSGSHNQGDVPGAWANSYHTYGLYRHANSCDVYYDGVLVKSYPTDDGGAPQYLILNIGEGSTLKTGSGGALRADYVRVWN
jgi:hypothetical protein